MAETLVSGSVNYKYDEIASKIKKLAQDIHYISRQSDIIGTINDSATFRNQLRAKIKSTSELVIAIKNDIIKVNDSDDTDGQWRKLEQQLLSNFERLREMTTAIGTKLKKTDPNEPKVAAKMNILKQAIEHINSKSDVIGSNDDTPTFRKQLTAKIQSTSEITWRIRNEIREEKNSSDNPSNWGKLEEQWWLNYNCFIKLRTSIETRLRKIRPSSHGVKQKQLFDGQNCYVVELHADLEAGLTQAIIDGATRRKNIIYNLNSSSNHTSVIADDTKAIHELCQSFVKRQYENKIYYTEVSYCPHSFCGSKLSVKHVLITILKELSESASKYGIIIKSILSSLRSWNGGVKATEIIQLAHEFTDKGVVGVDLIFDGSDSKLDVKWKKIFYDAKIQYNLNVAMVCQQPFRDSLYQALGLYASRVKFCYRQGSLWIYDKYILKTIKQKNIHLECFVLSTDFTANGNDHKFWETLKNSNISFNTNNDRSFLDQNSAEANKLRVNYFSKDDFVRTLLNAAKASFLNSGEKKKLIIEIKKRIHIVHPTFNFEIQHTKRSEQLFQVKLDEIKIHDKTKKKFVIYAFTFQIAGNTFSYSFEERYSQLNKLNEALLQDESCQKLFNYSLPKFPAKNWMKDYLKEKNYKRRANDLLIWLKHLVAEQDIFSNEIFVDGIKLSEKKDIMKKIKALRCNECQHLNSMNNIACKVCHAIRCDNCDAFNDKMVDNCKSCFSWKCDVCLYFSNVDGNKYQTCPKCHKRCLKVPVTVKNPFPVQFTVQCTLSSLTTIGDLLVKIVKYINEKHYPQKYYIQTIHRNSFLSSSSLNVSVNDKYAKWSEISIMKYNDKLIVETGIKVDLNLARYKHIVRNNAITCKYISHDIDEKKKDISSEEKINYELGDDGNDEKIEHSISMIDAMKCPIYKAMKVDYDISEKHLKHLEEFTHFTDEYKERTKCRFGQDCHAYVRLKDGGNRLDDRCHVKMYNHPPRTRRLLQLSENTNSFVVNTKYSQNHQLYKPIEDDRIQYKVAMILVDFLRPQII